MMSNAKNSAPPARQQEVSEYSKKITSILQKDTARAQLLRAILDGEVITGIDALRKYGVFRLAAEVHFFRSLGVQINSESVTVRKANDCTSVVSRYWL